MKINQREFWVALARLQKPAVEIASEIGIHATILSRWVRGWHEVPKDYESKLAEILEVPKSELFIQSEVQNET